MAGIFIPEATDLRIPGVRMSLGEKLEVSTDPVELRMDLWPYWLDIGIDHGIEAIAAREELLEAKEDGDKDAKAAFLGSECKSSMVAICAAAFAVDNFYARARQYRDMSAIEAVWNSRRTPRHTRIFETLRQTFSFRITNEKAKVLRRGVKETFKYRGWAVHPSADYRQAVMHEALGVGVEWRFVAFTSENAGAIVFAAAQLIHLCLLNPRRDNAELVEWCEGTSKRGSERWERAKREFQRPPQDGE